MSPNSRVFSDPEHRVLGLSGRVDAESIDQLTDQLLRLHQASHHSITLYLSPSCAGAGMSEFLRLAAIIDALRAPVESLALPGTHGGFTTLVLATGRRRSAFAHTLLSNACLTESSESLGGRLGFHAQATNVSEKADAWTRAAFRNWTRNHLGLLVQNFENNQQIWTAQEALTVGLIDNIITPEQVHSIWKTKTSEKHHHHANEISTLTPGRGIHR